VRSTGLTPAVVAAALAELELAGLAVQADGLYRVVVPVH
jgi:predicted Rossmann fold nucleotide-binding protein DprA/Smf involved in DNA uptake